MGILRPMLEATRTSLQQYKYMEESNDHYIFKYGRDVINYYLDFILLFD